MTLDEILEDVPRALGLDEGQILVNVIVLGEWVDLDEDAEQPNRRRLAMVSADELEPWTSIGMLRFAQMTEERALRRIEDEP